MFEQPYNPAPTQQPKPAGAMPYKTIGRNGAWKGRRNSRPPNQLDLFSVSETVEQAPETAVKTELTDSSSAAMAVGAIEELPIASLKTFEVAYCPDVGLVRSIVDDVASVAAMAAVDGIASLTPKLATSTHAALSDRPELRNDASLNAAAEAPVPDGSSILRDCKLDSSAPPTAVPADTNVHSAGPEMDAIPTGSEIATALEQVADRASMAPTATAEMEHTQQGDSYFSDNNGDEPSGHLDSTTVSASRDGDAPTAEFLIGSGRASSEAATSPVSPETDSQPPNVIVNIRYVMPKDESQSMTPARDMLHAHCTAEEVTDDLAGAAVSGKDLAARWTGLELNSGGGSKERGSSEGISPMDDYTKMTAAIEAAPMQFRQPMRNLRRLFKHGFTLDQIASLSCEMLATEMQLKVTTRNGNGIKNVRLQVRSALSRLYTLSINRPDLQLPQFSPVEERQQLVQVLEAELSDRYRQDELAWRVRSGTHSSMQCDLRPLKIRTFNRYQARNRQIIGIATQLGILPPNYGIKDLTMSNVVAAVMAVLDGRLSRWCGASFVASLLRAARDLYGDDGDHAAHIESLKGELTARIPNPELTADELLELDNLAENKLFAAALGNAPAAIAERSKERGLSPKDRLARLAAASALALKMRFPILSVDEIASFDTAARLRSDGNEYQIGILDRLVEGGMRWDLCPPSVNAILKQWNEYRRLFDVTSTLLFPKRTKDKGGRFVEDAFPQNPATVGAFIMGEVEAVMGVRLGFRSLKTVVTHIGLKAHPTETVAISQAVGIKHEYLKARWAPVIDGSL